MKLDFYMHSKLDSCFVRSLVFAISSIFGASNALAATTAMQTGYYLGLGDNAHVALKVMPKIHGVQKAVISASHSSYKNAKGILKHEMKNAGIITTSYHKGDYILTLNRRNGYPVCRYNLTYNKSYSGFILSPANHAEISGCQKYSGFNLSYFTPIPAGALRRVSDLH